MYRAPHKCCICGEKLTVTRLSCEHCGTTMEGRFTGCRFCSLSPEEELFLLTFIKNRGSIKDVERELGISYPTVRAALDNLIASLGLTGTESPAEEAPKEHTDRSRRKSDPDTARARKDILKMLSEHRITADEAAKKLKELS
ncbi:MAG: DUF2089 domain-containing protein [Clostridia bacterium]|nr:DUF2089 domain-containing protein [Clostridia bacterium]